MARSLNQLPPIERELIGWFDIAYSPDDGGFYVDMAWDYTIHSPIFRNAISARAWARRNGGTHEFKRGANEQFTKC